MTVEDVKSEACCGCAACFDLCPVQAIVMDADNHGNRRPFVNKDICISCGLCAKICPQYSPLNTLSNHYYEKKTLVGYYNNLNIAYKSSSGGLFYAIAERFINCGGVVYGSKMSHENDELICTHVRVTDVKDLYSLQGSKYVQSKTDGIFSLVKQDLKEGKLCLFSGTSCQVAALKKIVGNHPNLYTIDLVCHGVPKDHIFYDYIRFFERKNNCKVLNVSFRKKGVMINGREDTYVLTLSCRKSDGALFDIIIPNGKSPFYRLFISRAGYRESCYNCIFAKINKPSDITLGDFRPSIEEQMVYNLTAQYHYSTIIIHSLKGENLINGISDRCSITNLPLDLVVSHHHNLHYPSRISDEGNKLLQIYERGGYESLYKTVRVDFAKTQIKYILSRIVSFVCKP